MQYLDIFGLKTFAWFMAVGCCLGLAAGIFLVVFLGRRGLFKRGNIIYNFMVKCFYVYVPVVFAMSFTFLFLILGLHYETRMLFESHRKELTQVSLGAVQRAFSGIHDATGGGDLPNEFIPNLAEVVSSFVDEAAFATISEDKILLEITGPVRYGLKLSLKAAFESELRARYQMNRMIPANGFYESFQFQVLSSFMKGYYPKFLWDEIASQFSPIYLRILLNSLFFLFPVFFEVAAYRLIFRRKKAAEKEEAPEPAEKKPEPDILRPMVVVLDPDNELLAELEKKRALN